MTFEALYLMIEGGRIWVTGYMFPITGCMLQVACCKVACCRCEVEGCGWQVVGYMLQTEVSDAALMLKSCRLKLNDKSWRYDSHWNTIHTSWLNNSREIVHYLLFKVRRILTIQHNFRNSSLWSLGCIILRPKLFFVEFWYSTIRFFCIIKNLL